MNKILIKKTVEVFFSKLLREQKLKHEFYAQFKLLFYNEENDNCLSKKRINLLKSIVGPQGKLDKTNQSSLKGPFLKIFSDFAQIGIYSNNVSETQIILLNEFIQYISTLTDDTNFNEVLDYFSQLANELLYES